MAVAPRQGAVLGHAGRQRRRAGVRELPLPRGRRSALEEPGEPRAQAHARAGPLPSRPAAARTTSSWRRLSADAPRDAGLARSADSATDSNDVVSSQGVQLLGEGRRSAGFPGRRASKTRRVEPRNTPTVINAVFNHRQFWDGRAENVFNGVNHLGERDPDARVFGPTIPTRPLEVQVELRELEPRLAGRGADPERSRDGRAGPHARRTSDASSPRASAGRARRLAKLRPLAKQKVATDGQRPRFAQPVAAAGLDIKRYDEMIKAAFHEQWWRSSKVVRVHADGSKKLRCFDQSRMRTSTRSANDYSLIEYNFALFFGLAVQMYEATLVSDDTPWDRFRREHPSATDPALNPGQHYPEPYQPARALRRAPLQRPHARRDEPPLLELPRAGRAHGRLGRRIAAPQRPGA